MSQDKEGRKQLELIRSIFNLAVFEVKGTVKEKEQTVSHEKLGNSSTWFSPNQNTFDTSQSSKNSNEKAKMFKLRSKVRLPSKKMMLYKLK